MVSNKVDGVLFGFLFNLLGFFCCWGFLFVCLFWLVVGFGFLFIVVLRGFVYLFILWVFL